MNQEFVGSGQDTYGSGGATHQQLHMLQCKKFILCPPENWALQVFAEQFLVMQRVDQFGKSLEVLHECSQVTLSRLATDKTQGAFHLRQTDQTPYYCAADVVVGIALCVRKQALQSVSHVLWLKRLRHFNQQS